MGEITEADVATCKESLQVHALPDFVESALGVVALSDFPSVESVLRHHISDLTRRLAEVEAERDALRERCGKLEAALVEIGDSEDRICGYCEGEGNRYADGKAHYYSEHAPTIPCPECGGRRRIRDMDSEDMAAVANAALATEVKDCPECDGAGQQINMAPGPLCGVMRICPACGGTGVKQGASK